MECEGDTCFCEILSFDMTTPPLEALAASCLGDDCNEDCCCCCCCFLAWLDKACPIPAGNGTCCWTIKHFSTVDRRDSMTLSLVNMSVWFWTIIVWLLRMSSSWCWTFRIIPLWALFIKDKRNRTWFGRMIWWWWRQLTFLWNQC